MFRCNKLYSTYSSFAKYGRMLKEPYSANIIKSLQFGLCNCPSVQTRCAVIGSRSIHLSNSSYSDRPTNRNSEVDNKNTSFLSNIKEHLCASLVAATVVKSASIDNVEEAKTTLDFLPIPEPPSIPEVSEETLNQLNALGEPTFASLGLGGWTPVGIVQNCFEYLHVTLGVPWWAAIVLGTIVIRSLMLPLVIISQRNAAKMNNYLPQLQAIQLKMTEARQMGNQLEAAKYSQDLVLFMKAKGLNPLKNMIVPLAQMPIFLSFFMGLREMANVPVDSMRTGGLFWFTDLTVPDQFYIMPILTSLTMWATIEMGTDAAKLNSQNMHVMKYVFRALPLVIFPFTLNFPGAILCYWVSTNFISLIQVGILRIPKVRAFFHIDPLVKHDPKSLPVQQKGFKEGLKESWTNLKISKELEERKRLDEIQFQRAGKGPITKTYKYDPTKQVSNPNAINVKNR